jgi:hypothetical protein
MSMRTSTTRVAILTHLAVNLEYAARHTVLVWFADCAEPRHSDRERQESSGHALLVVPAAKILVERLPADLEFRGEHCLLLLGLTRASSVH